MTFCKLSAALILIATFSVSACAEKKPAYIQGRLPSSAQAALIDKAIAQERMLISNIRQRTPLVETYIQETTADTNTPPTLSSDMYILSRVDFSKAFHNKAYEQRPASSPNRGFFQNMRASVSGISKKLGDDREITYNPTGFMEMMFIDPYGFDKQHYVFGYEGSEVLGSVHTEIFDVYPSDNVTDSGRFYGRIWVENQSGNIVHFNGAYTGQSYEDARARFFHCDSWRMNVQPNLWLPSAVYVEETLGKTKSRSYGVKAQTRFWGYSLRQPVHQSEKVSVKIENAEDKSEDSSDAGPQQATHAWINQAENNVVDRLEQAGLVAPLNPGGYENKVLDQIVTNLAVPNNLSFTDPIRTRILLVSTIEATTVGNTILLSKGLIDTLPNEESIASVVAMQLAHIVMGHHVDTRYAFNDRLLFPDEGTFQKIHMDHSDHDSQEAAQKAMQYLGKSMYKDKLQSAGLYYSILAERALILKDLSTPRLGDSLLKSDGTPWMDALYRINPKQTLVRGAALPLGSWTKTDPWSDKVYMLNTKRSAPQIPSNGEPLEITPIVYKLQRYEEALTEQAAATATPTLNNKQAPATEPQ